jgi:hypothetical protein
MHWIAWAYLTAPKSKEGMSFQNLEMFNQALLGKHGWRFITNPDSLFFCARVLKTKYYPRALSTWRVIVSGREALSCGPIKRIGDGNLVSVLFGLIGGFQG